MKLIKNSLHNGEYTYIEGESSLGGDNPTLHVFDIRRAVDNRLLSEIKFHSGSFNPNELNGILNEDLLVVLINRLESFQKSKLKCRENEFALQHLYEALFWLKLRHDNKANSTN